MAQIAYEAGAKVIVLPTIPFGNNAQQQDQTATIHFSTATAAAILMDVAKSLIRQKIDRLVILTRTAGMISSRSFATCSLKPAS